MNVGPCTSMKMDLIAVTALLCNVNIIACYGAFTQVVYVQPTHPLNVTCQDCYTLNEWIESGFVPFANDTIVILLPGNHLITSARRSLITENVSSLLIAGQQGDPVNVSCLHGFVFEFHNFIDVRIAFITFNSCAVESTSIFSLEEYPEIAIMPLTLLFVQAQGVVITGITVIDGGIIVRECVNGSSFTLRHSQLISPERGFFYSSQRNSKCSNGIPLERLHILNSSTTVQVIRSPCTIVKLQELNLRNIKDLTIAIHLAALWVIFEDVVLHNNFFSVNQINIISNYTDFKGQTLLSENSGSGVVIRQSHVIIHPASSVSFYNNHFNHMAITFAECIFINIINAEISFVNNTIENGGVLIIRSSEGTIHKSKLLLINNTSVNFSGIDDAGIILFRNSKWDILNGSFLTFFNNSSPPSGGLTLIDSQIAVINITASFEGNIGQNGGGLALYKMSRISFITYSLLQFCHNKARNKGGAIFVEDSDYINAHTKIAHGHFRALFIYNDVQIDLEFTDNVAYIAGMEIYGGWIDIHEHGRQYSIHHYDPRALSTVASNPTRICICTASIPNCNIITYRVDVFSGQAFHIEAAAVGQRMGVVPSIVIADAKGKRVIGEGQDVQSVGRECTQLYYSVHSLRSSEVLTLKAQDIGVPNLNFELSRILPLRYHHLFTQFSIMAVIKSCPIGFELQNLECTCSTKINELNGVSCDVITYTITRTNNIWLYARTWDNSTTHHITLHKHCPYDYCRNDIPSLTIHLNNPDEQCAFNRSGILCGGCQAGLSQVFGSARCMECSQVYIVFIIIVGTAIAGIVLVVFLLCTNLTVSSGMVNGLIFYCNVIRLNQAVFFPLNSSNTFLGVFIAWLNLDLGFEVCFYDGLDAYAKTWLQFAFPAYIWLIVTTIIVVSHYSSVASKVFGNNAVQVLATLFLLSYVKLLRVIVTAITYTNLIFSNGITERVWLLDGNIHFLQGRHIPLFIASLITIAALFVFYTLPLIFIQLLQRASHRCALIWVHRLMPLFDAYTGPFKHKHRYWIGISLLLRLVFVLAFSLNLSNDPAINLLTIAVVASTMLIYCSYVKVYKFWMTNVNEISFLLNLVLLSVVTYFQMATRGNIALSTTLSTSIAFITFLLILFRQTAKQFVSSRIVRYRWLKLCTRIRKRTVDCSNNHIQCQESSQSRLQNITHTSIELTEPLLN